MIKDITPSLANVDNLHDQDSSRVLQARFAHNKARPQRFCISFTWGILGTCNKNIFLAYICFSFKPHGRYLGSNQNHQFFYYLLSLFSTLLKMSFCGYLLFKIRKYSLWNKSHLSIETSIYMILSFFEIMLLYRSAEWTKLITLGKSCFHQSPMIDNHNLTC